MANTKDKYLTKGCIEWFATKEQAENHFNSVNNRRGTVFGDTLIGHSSWFFRKKKPWWVTWTKQYKNPHYVETDINDELDELLGK